MFNTGLVSVSFRNESPETIIEAMTKNGLSLVEWGGDIHVPPGDLPNAERIAELTKKAGIKVAAYGSYHRLSGNCSKESFIPILETAKVLGAPVIRIWAGEKGSEETTEELRQKMADEARNIALLADRYDITIAMECHQDTLTDHWQSSLDFLNEVNHPRLKMYWQPSQFHDKAYNIRAAKELAAHTINLHVFHWDKDNKYPLQEGTEVWREYLNVFKASGKSFGLLLEFMHDGRLETLEQTAKTLNSWV